MKSPVPLATAAALAVIAASGSAPVFAQNAPATAAAATAAAPGWTAAQYYESGVRNLRAGRWFERAEAQFAAATKAEPDNFRNHLALGCARASRAASLTHAALFSFALAEMRREHPKRLADWEAAQKDPKSDGYGDPRPAPAPPPFVLRTKDDERPFRLTTNQARAQVKERTAGARAAWDRALALAHTPAERAEVQYIRGWGLRLLTRSEAYMAGLAIEEAKRAGVPVAPATVSVPPRAEAPKKEALRALVNATESDPSNALYWQSLGDALAGYGGWQEDVSAMFNSGNGDALDPSGAAESRKKTLAAYHKSLERSTRNAPLWYHVFRLTLDQAAVDALNAAGGGSPKPAPPPPAAEDALRRAAEADPGNACPWFELAHLAFRKTNYGNVLGSPADKRDDAFAEVAKTSNEQSRQAARAALTDIERGSRAGRYTVPLYRPVIPRLLVVAWNYGRYADLLNGADLSSGSRTRELARAVCGYALVTAREGDTAEAVRACRAIIGMGQVMAGDWPVEDRTPGGGESYAAMTGNAVTAIGYTNLRQIYEQAGDRENAARVAAEHDAFRRRVEAFNKAVQQKVNEANEPFAMLRLMY